MGHLHNAMLGFSEALEIQLLNLSTKTELNFGEIKINDQKYNAYLYNYLTNLDSENKQSYDIFLDYLVEG